MPDQFVPSLKAWRLLCHLPAELRMNHEDPPVRTSVRLTRKFANAIDGIDLSHNEVGDFLSLSSHDARVLIAEGWAAPCEQVRAEANDEGTLPRAKRKGDA